MKTILVNYSDLAGGAAIAAYRTHLAVRQAGVDSSMWVSKKVSDDWTVRGSNSTIYRLCSHLRTMLGRAVPQLFFRDRLKSHRSFNWLPSGLPRRLNDSDADLIHLVWINGETLSIGDLSRIDKPKIMTLQDMWAFNGAEHYSTTVRWKTGYLSENRGPSVSGLDLDRWVWNRKRRRWREPFQLVAISEWLADCVRESALFSDWPVTVIPNPVDTNVWQPLDQAMARRAFNLPENQRIILFGALGGTSNVRKGYALLQQSLFTLASQRDDIHLVVYGQSRPENPPANPFPTTYVGRLSDPVTMCLLNNAADVFVTPATQEAFGQTASEAHACGLPVVAFRDTGIADIVDHQNTGYLASLGDAEELAEGVSWVLDRSTDTTGLSSQQLRENSRERAVARFSYEVVGDSYRKLYDQVLSGAIT